MMNLSAPTSRPRSADGKFEGSSGLSYNVIEAALRSALLNAALGDPLNLIEAARCLSVAQDHIRRAALRAGVSAGELP